MFPSLDEGFGIPISRGFIILNLPVICSDIDVFKEVGGDCVQYFKVGDSVSLSEKIISVLVSDKLEDKMIILSILINLAEKTLLKVLKKLFLTVMISPKKNILLLHSSNDLYGASKIFLQLIDLFISKGFNVHVVLPDRGKLDDFLNNKGHYGILS